MQPETKRGFKKKTIEKTIRHKMREWIKTLPEEWHKEVQDNYIVTGGAIASMLMGDLPNDYDVYFRDITVADKLAGYYIKQLAVTEKVSEICTVAKDGRVKICIKSAGIASEDTDLSDYKYFEMLPPSQMEEYFETHFKQSDKSYNAVLISSNAISLHNNVQLIMRFVGLPEEIHKNYDFAHCTNWYTEMYGLMLNQPALESILSKELKYVGSLYPLCSMFRLKKFIKRGWTITAGEMLKIGWDINKLDLDDPTVLEDQLIGVDAAYFTQLLNCLKNKKDIDRTYLFECINRVFDTNEEFTSDDEIRSDSPERD